ncbi:MAG: glycosyltransferase family 2 protein [Lachnospiraceae bacterium]|nr:glycosyltransferase family 2 protein [Lachnospiraceae bacterium]
MIGIVVLNYRSWDLSLRCIKSIAKYPPKEEYQIYLVDNDSPNSPEYNLEQVIKDYSLKYVKTKKNLGYNGGNNVGIKAALEDGCDAILYTNNDIVFEKDSIQFLKDELDDQKKIGITCPKIKDEQGEIQKCHMMHELTMIDKYRITTKLNLIFRKAYRNYYGLDLSYEEPFYPYAAQGSCVMMSRHCALEVTPFDEVPFLYEEELMLGHRMKEKGYRELYCPKAIVRHLHGGSTKHVKAFAFAHMVRSEIYYCKEYLHAKDWMIRPLVWYRSCVYWLKGLRDKDFREGKYRAIINS